MSLSRYDPRSWQFDPGAALEILIDLAVPTLLALALHWAAFLLLGRIVRASQTQVDNSVVAAVRSPARWAVIAAALAVASAADPRIAAGWAVIAAYLLPALVGWTAYALIDGLIAGLELEAEASEDPVTMRARRTRTSILGRTAKVVVVVITVALILFQLPGVRQIGVTLMASAGLAALAVGAAAQPALKSLIAGLQMALTQPLRLGDMVKVEGQSGRVEEIRWSFVTVRTWDERLLVVPTVRFLDGIFENWSRVSERLTGPVFLYLDPATEIAPIRAEFERFVASQPEFDGRSASLDMTEARPESVELRVSVSAATIADLWNLRVKVREHMFDWLRREMPDALVRHRLGAAPVEQGVEPPPR
ncbi:mechanosensitive ion channel family protein [Qipengyuania sediminis]|uniref:mechanosensitive ion channel family protein n=1 Tax=Qipengyuania sediminis TaxID=1532023 RepID=UPI001059DB24|nr:mechanosensitive ion channel domain-containing protein [Qipengyuania sediminis]